MLFTDGVFVGVDPSAGERPIHYAALDRNLRLIAQDTGDMESVLAFIAAQERAVVAIDSPQSPNRGLMGRPEIRRQYNLQPGGRTWRDWRVCEYELRRRNIRVYNTPAELSAIKSWVRTGFELFKRLDKLGYRTFSGRQPEHPRISLEARSHAGYSVLLDRRPFLKDTLEGRMQRQLVLYLQGVDLSNPMQALEEITRHRLLTGELELQVLKSAEELEALMAAFTAASLALKPEEITSLGDPEEGLIVLPTPEVRDFYP